MYYLSYIWIEQLKIIKRVETVDKQIDISEYEPVLKQFNCV